MRPQPFYSRVWFWIAITAAVGLLLIYWYRDPLLWALEYAYELLTEREKITVFVESFGSAAPLAFMAIQVFQVILAPIPGEATGFIGGYLFGALKGTIYSTLALGIGSWINFAIGRFLGKRWIRRFIPADKMARFDHLLRHQGVLIVFLLFLFPGFPKDYLSLVLGVSTMPLRIFLPLAWIGRIPGTLLLSLQGALVFEESYHIFSAVMAVNLIAVYIAYRHREKLYRWIEKKNNHPPVTIDGKDK